MTIHQRLHASRLATVLTGALLIQSAGCAEINSQVREEYIALRTERVALESHYRPEFHARLTSAARFEDAHLIVEATRHKTCRNQVVTVEQRVQHTTNKLENPGLTWGMLLLGGTAAACGSLQFTEHACISETTNEETEEAEPLSDGARRGFGVAFLTVGAVALTTALVDAIRATDKTQVLGTRQRPQHVEEKSCGREPFPGATVVIHTAGADAAPYRARTALNGKAVIPLTELALFSTRPDEPIGRIIVEEQAIPTVNFPQQWLLSRNEYFARQLFAQAQASNASADYLRFLQHFPDDPNAPAAHRSFQALALTEQSPIVLANYLQKFGTHSQVLPRRATLTDRLRDLQVDDAYQKYVAQWLADGSAQKPALDDSIGAAQALGARLFAFHDAQLTRLANADLAAREADYQAAIAVAPPDLQATARIAYAQALLADIDRQQQEDSAALEVILERYRDAVTWAGATDAQRQVREQAITFLLAAFHTRLSASDDLDADADALQSLLEAAIDFAADGTGRTRVRVAWQEFGDQRADVYLKQAAQLAKSGSVPQAARALQNASQFARSDKMRQQVSTAYIEHFAAQIRARGAEILKDTSGRQRMDATVMEDALSFAQSERDKDILRGVWIDACSDIAAQRAQHNPVSELTDWYHWMRTAAQFADSAAAQKKLNARFAQIERALQKRYPPAKLESFQHAVLVYAPGIDRNDHDAIERALTRPASHKGTRMLLTLRITRAVGDQFMAEAPGGRTVFVYSTNPTARARLRLGARAQVLGTIDGTINHNTADGKKALPRINIIWAE